MSAARPNSPCFNPDQAITLALNFGRMRVQLPAAAQLRIFTPTIVATPIDIGGAPRDFTVGLDLNDSLCVVAASGALRLEHQFTGEGLIVPQAGEFFLAAGKLLPVAGVAGQLPMRRTSGSKLRPRRHRNRFLHRLKWV